MNKIIICSAFIISSISFAHMFEADLDSWNPAVFKQEVKQQEQRDILIVKEYIAQVQELLGNMPRPETLSMNASNETPGCVVKAEEEHWIFKHKGKIALGVAGIGAVVAIAWKYIPKSANN